MMLPGPHVAVPLPLGCDARLGYRRLRRPTRLPELVPCEGFSGWVHAWLQRLSARRTAAAV